MVERAAEHELPCKGQMAGAPRKSVGGMYLGQRPIKGEFQAEGTDGRCRK